MFNDGFYPTPKGLAQKMCSKVDWANVKCVLDPEAGKGDLLNFVKNKNPFSGYEFYAVEIEPQLQHILRSEGYHLVDDDFLSFSGGEQFDVIVMNPPFDEGYKHLLKAIDILYSGQIVCILNAETIRNPYSNGRKSLIKKLKELNADIEFIAGAFKNSERPTGVEVALIYIDKRRDLSDDLLSGVDDTVNEIDIEEKKTKDLAFKDDIKAIVQRYEHAKQVGMQLVLSFYSQRKIIGEQLNITIPGLESYDNVPVKKAVNKFLLNLRKSYWHEILNTPTVMDKLTSKKREEFLSLLNQQADMDFTLKNIYAFVSNLSRGYSAVLKESVMELFDKITYQHSFYPETKRNILHFNGWKTNNAFKVGKKFILPINIYNNLVKYRYIEFDESAKIDDIDKVFSYFAAKPAGSYKKAVDAIKDAFEKGVTKNIESEFFLMSVYKKGTIHFTVKDEELLRRFNVMACKEKGWLPHDYGSKSFDEFSKEEKEVAKSFEGKTGNYSLIPDHRVFPLLAA